MKSVILFSLLFSLTACQNRGSSRPTATNSTPAPTSSAPAQPTVNEQSALKEFEKAKDFLVAMGAQINGKDIVIPDQPTNYKDTKDLKVALEVYRNSAHMMMNISRSPEQRQVWQDTFDSASSVLAEYAPQLQAHYLNDLENIGITESRMDTFGFRLKKTDGNWVMSIDKNYKNHYPLSTHKKELAAYITQVENFLNLYGDGQSHLDFQTKVNLEKKLDVSKRLATSLNN